MMMTPNQLLALLINDPNFTVNNRMQTLINSKTVGMNPRTGEIKRLYEYQGDDPEHTLVNLRRLYPW